MSILHVFMLACVGLLLSACSTPSISDRDASRCADVIAISSQSSADGTYRFDVTVTSADTDWEKYADAWEIRTEAGVVLATRELAHPHVDEQPFTRSTSGVRIPTGVNAVTVSARDSIAGFCGRTVTIPLP